MCLESVLSNVPVKEGVGFQVFRVDKWHHLHSLFRRRTPCPIGVWTEAGKHPEYLYVRGESYQSGFHIMLTKSGAKKYAKRDIFLPNVIRKVQFKRAVACGYQDYNLEVKVIVAKQRRIIPVREK